MVRTSIARLVEDNPPTRFSFVEFSRYSLGYDRREILPTRAAKTGLTSEPPQALFPSQTAEEDLKSLQSLDRQTGDNWVERVQGSIANTIDRRCREDTVQQANQNMTVGSILFDRSRSLFFSSKNGMKILQELQVPLGYLWYSDKNI